ncbi:heavy metal translocating P-type ATPase [Mangrovimonas aestuarii]|uniref:heavy metal translocating P-type ATPase n=1 Tax=Mangrovimonas aestuarii TaxID=3018443 RepID=UPI002379F275|nr:heavy metal translocating P-type ATPase metal-binding domain-containing protein [Mangrovimonas aestuarii]
MSNIPCYHCGTVCTSTIHFVEDKSFCCNGCKTVYEILSESELTCYYDLQDSPGATPKHVEGKYDFLNLKEFQDKLLEFSDNSTQIVNLSIPHIHCSSCIWILENLNRLNNAIISSQVDFNKKSVRVTFKPEKLSLKEVVLLLNKIGYEPYISLESYNQIKKRTDRSLIYKLGIAGFAFGNVMFLSFPEYFEVNEFWLEQYKHLFRWLMFAFSIPVVVYAANDYFISAYKGLSSKLLNIDVPIALGILVLFIRSTVEIIFDLGSGFFDSLTGLVFFLLLGKFFQRKTYAFLSFERDYKSYFPIAVTKVNNDGNETPAAVQEIKKGDRIIIRNEELIPVDGILINGNAEIDYSFVTGESDPVNKYSGDKIFAGGKQMGSLIEMEVTKSVEQSYLTQLWSNDIFNNDKTDQFSNITNSISKHFTIVVLSIAILSTLYWILVDTSKAIQVFTAVLIIACPCAIALAAPFTLGNILRIFGKAKFYLKNISVIEQLASVNSIIFDKTGTITTTHKTKVSYFGETLTTEERSLLKASLKNSNHPLSRSLYNVLNSNNIVTVDDFKEFPGKGIEAVSGNNKMKIGSASFVNTQITKPNGNTSVHISTNNDYKGKFSFYSNYRKGITNLFNKLSKQYKLTILSGDNDGERQNLEKMLPPITKLLFNQKPEDKLEYIKHHQNQGDIITMVGDGLNDAGALAQSNVGIAISENINVFSPACDAILDASQLNQLAEFIKISKKGVKIIKWSFMLSLVYNLIGLYFAVTGQLSPVIAAILMPLSSISVVAFTTLATSMIAKKIH